MPLAPSSDNPFGQIDHRDYRYTPSIEGVPFVRDADRQQMLIENAKRVREEFPASV